ncbi:hypothetical protein Bpfe_016027, partial [Biomphalaria pfeifferi]
LEYVQILRQVICHCNVFIFYESGRRLLMFPVFLLLVLQSVSLRMSYLYLLLPMMYYVNEAIVVRGLLTVNAYVDLFVTSSRIQVEDGDRWDWRGG